MKLHWNGCERQTEGVQTKRYADREVCRQRGVQTGVVQTEGVQTGVQTEDVQTEGVQTERCADRECADRRCCNRNSYVTSTGVLISP
jgi:hypothetical protein